MENINFNSSPAKRPKLTKSGAETMAIEALSYLAGDPSRLDVFWSFPALAWIICVRRPRKILDHLASDERLLVAFAAQTRQNPEVVAEARDVLSPSQHGS